MGSETSRRLAVASKRADRKVDRNEVKRLAAMLRLGDAGLTPGNRQQTGCINKARPQRH